MRDVEFRGKRKDNGKWIFGYLKIGSKGRMYISVCEKTKLGDNWLVFEVIPETVGEYTGLLDCKGQKIFEGDITKAISLTTMGEKIQRICEVIFIAGTFLFQEGIDNGIPKGFPLHDAIRFQNTINMTIEVIGNITDNPELLETN